MADYTLSATFQGTANNVLKKINPSLSLTSQELVGGNDGLEVDATGFNLCTFGAGFAPGQFTGLGALVIENTSATTKLYVGVISGTKEYYEPVAPKGLFVKTDIQMDANVTGAGFGTLSNADTIFVKSASGTISINWMLTQSTD